jgi:hypothetical protein
MSKFLWNLQSIFYREFRRNPISKRILREENQSFQALLKMIPEMDIKTILDIGAVKSIKKILCKDHRTGLFPFND